MLASLLYSLSVPGTWFHSCQVATSIDPASLEASLSLVAKVNPLVIWIVFEASGFKFGWLKLSFTNVFE